MRRIVGLGEILWDLFPDGPRFGGAPANFACSAAELAKQTARVTIVSAVGGDELGHAAVQALKARGVETSAIQTSAMPTGKVTVQLSAEGVASYRFDEDSAWDHLVMTPALRELAASCDAVCFGTLGQRAPAARAAIREFVRATPAASLRVLDVNLRAPYVDSTRVVESLELANVLKLNEAELPQIAAWSNCRGNPVESMRKLAQKYALGCVALTRGADGAILLRGETSSNLPGISVAVADTVGAGDAYTAAMVLGLLAELDVATINQAAIRVAAHVCTQRGATMALPELFGEPVASNPWP